MEIIRQIIINTDFVGFHKWDNAPDEVAFLRNSHRHIFKVSVTLKVNHNDRDKEFFIWKNKINNYIDLNINKQDCGSCEMIAEKILISHPDIVSVVVSEDGENGAMLFKNN